MKPCAFPGEQVLRWQVHGPQQMLLNPVTQQSTFTCRGAATTGCRPAPPSALHGCRLPAGPAPLTRRPPFPSSPPNSLSENRVCQTFSKESGRREAATKSPPLLWVPVPEAHGPWTRVHVTHQPAALGRSPPWSTPVTETPQPPGNVTVSLVTLEALGQQSLKGESD